ncbi:putative Proteasome activator pa28 beta subunit [Blattamonas nauphoetae]|uniref:Proteasome activator pa28 beta subunit n=1 Tax=Blattamonas nauphoetae TaxID=2049346 RepID=A0ABQ9X990_9EUKA|nr:putative Proteasome activator pa28 beta subunit [Blattamonas nauphoetae]
MSSKRKTPVADLIDPQLKEKCIGMIPIFAQKAVELEKCRLQYNHIVEPDSAELSRILDITRETLDHPENKHCPTNPEIDRIDQFVQGHLLDFINNMSSFLVWFTLQKPAISEKQSLAAEVIETIASVVGQLETSASAGLSKFSMYHSTRAQLLTKYYQFPHFEDLRNAIISVDAQAVTTSIHTIADLRNFYLFVHDLVGKNFDKMNASHE